MSFLNSSNIKDLGTYKNTDHFLNSFYDGCLKNVRLLARWESGSRATTPDRQTPMVGIDSCHLHDPASAFDFLCNMTVAKIKTSLMCSRMTNIDQ